MKAANTAAAQSEQMIDVPEFKVGTLSGKLPGLTRTVESSALAVSYYLCPVNNPNQAKEPYVAECSDIQEALGMTHAEGEIFAALWRRCAARTLGRDKAGNSAVRDAEKIYHYAKRVLSVDTGKKVL